MAPSPLTPDVKEAVEQYLDSEILGGEAREAALPKIVDALNAKTVELLDMVIYLEQALNDATNPGRRRAATQLLADSLHCTAQLRLNFKHVETLSVFFLTKMKDWQCCEGAVGGLLAIVRRHGEVLKTLRRPDNEPLVAYTAKMLFKEVHTPSHTQGVRKLVLDLVHTLLCGWKTEVSALGLSLGEGVNSVIEEERDPRNLLLSFAIAKQLFEDYPECVGEQTTVALFEALTSYFPITFTPPKDDKFGITGEDLRTALNRAVSATDKLAAHVIPFLLDAAKDGAGDTDTTVIQALEMLTFVLQRYGAAAVRQQLGNLLAMVQDQVCNTTACSDLFADSVRVALQTALTGVPNGLQPHWVTKDVDPVLKALAQDAAKAESSLKSSGARKLLLAAAAANPMLLQRAWSFTMPLLVPPAEEGKGPAPPARLPDEALPFLLDLASLAEGKALLAQRQLRPALTASIETLCSIRPMGLTNGYGHHQESPARSPLVCAIELSAKLARLSNEDSGECFSLLCSAVLPAELESSRPPLTGSGSTWGPAWRQELSAAPAEDSCVSALVNAICTITAVHRPRALELVSAIQSTAGRLLSGDRTLSKWMPVALPRLLAAAALSLARATQEEVDKAASEAAAAELLAKAAALICGPALTSSARAQVMLAFAEALEGPSISAVGNAPTSGAAGAAAAWSAGTLAAALQKTSQLLPLLEGLGLDSEEMVDGLDRRGRTAAARRFLRVICNLMPPELAAPIRWQVIAAAAPQTGPPGKAALCGVAVLPATLPEAAEADWEKCSEVLPALCQFASGSSASGLPTELRPTLELLALEALEVLVEACPQNQVEILLTTFREAFGVLLNKSSKAECEPAAARGAACCWAAAAGALLRRGGFAQQAASFLEALLSALEQDAPVTPYVPLAFQVLMPPKFDPSSPSKCKLPPLALQQLSRTVLPSLVTRSKESSSASAKRAALESAVSLLCALPLEVATSDCMEELRWCALIGLKSVKESVAQRNGLDASSFAVQVLQLLLRALGASAAWVEDDLQSVVLPVSEVSSKHSVPLVRLAGFQALLKLLQQSHGHLGPFAKHIVAATKQGIEDRCREVRLQAIAALNAWHCGAVRDSET